MHIFVFFFLFFIQVFNPAYGFQVCTMTFNSSNEKQVFKSFYGDQAHFTELVPENKNPNWLKKACESQVKCDVLLISGHFGGVFFGEKTSPTLDLKQLETLGCDESCPGILNAKAVYLMGCNTLASKTPDHRSIDEYLHVLVNDGFPRNLAEEVAASRYANFGFSMSERMSLAFQNANELYGFSSTGPLGANAAPRLNEALHAGGNLEQALNRAFQGTSFRSVHPSSELSPPARALSCGLRSKNASIRLKTYSQVFKMDDFSSFFDQLMNAVKDPNLLSAWNQAQSQTLRFQFEQIANRIIDHASILIESQIQILKLKYEFGFISKAQYNETVNQFITSRIQSGLDYVALDQVCSIAKKDDSLNFDPRWLSLSKTQEDHPYFARLAGCFSNLPLEVISSLKSWVFETQNQATRREALRSLKGYWSIDEKNEILTRAYHWEASDQVEANESIGYFKVSVSDPLWIETRDRIRAVNSPSARDDERWNAFHAIQNQFHSIAACEAAANEFETLSGLGATWYCLQQFPEAITESSCTLASQHYQKLDPEKADDFIFYCWDRLREKQAIHRSECLGLSDALMIPGNRIKQNWNCMNQI